MPYAAARLPLVLLLSVAACERPGAAFVATARFDTAAVAGLPGETRPLLVRERGSFTWLLDSTTAAWADGNRVVVADLLTGEGWEAFAGPWRDDPAPPAGLRTLWLFPAGGVVHALDPSGRYHGWTRAGDPLPSWRFPEPLLTRPFAGPGQEGGAFGHPVGFVEGRAVVHLQGVGRMEAGEDTVPQRILIVDPEMGVVAELEDVPDLVWRSDEPGESGTVAGQGQMVVGRGATLARAVHGGRRVSTLDAGGRPLATRELEAGVEGLAIDADGRVWVLTGARDAVGGLGTIVLSRELEELFRVSLPGRVMDASGAHVLVMRPNPDRRSSHLVLLRLRPIRD